MKQTNLELQRKDGIKRHFVDGERTLEVLKGASLALRAGDIEEFAWALGVSLAGGSVWMPGVLSRKKQVAARLVDAGA